MTPHRNTRGGSQHRSEVSFALAFAVVCLLVAVQAGCSCSCSSNPRHAQLRRATPQELAEANRLRAEREAREDKAEAERRAKAEAEKKKKEEEHRQRVEAERIRREQQQREWQAKAQEKKEQAEPEKPRFPENPADWTKDDFPKARAAGEPKLVEAVNHLGEMFPTSEPAVAMLVSLLKPADKPASQPLIEAIVVALGRNETPQATQALRSLVDGKLETEHPSIARSMAMRALADRDASLFDELMLAGLRAADGDQRGAGAVRGAYDWEADLLGLIDGRAGPELRVRIARYALEPGTSARQREKLLGLLTRPAPANLASQVILLASPTIDPAAKPRLAQQLAMVSSCALQRLQGMPASVTPAFATAARPAGGRTATYGITDYGAPSKPAAAAGDASGIFDDPDLLRYAPAALWNDAAVTLVVQSLFQLEALDQAPHHLQLAAATPVGRVREELLAALRRNWHDGPAGLRKAGVPNHIVFDPALLAMLKTLPHATPAAKDWRRQLSAASKEMPQPGNVRLGEGQWHPLHRMKQHKATLEEEWAELVGETAWTLCFRLQAAAEAELAMQSTDAAAYRAEHYTPVPLHDDARVVAFHMAALPGPGAEWASEVQVDPLRVTYVRMVDTVSLLRTVSHYVRHLHQPAAYIALRTGWLSSFERDASKGTVRSVDVFIRRTSNTLYDLSDADERLVIQVLCIECIDPAPRQSAGSGRNSATLTEN